MIDDALRFMQQFHEPIRQSAAHVYVSAIPFTPSSCILFQTYAHTLRDIPKLISAPVAPATLINLPIQPNSSIALSVDCSRFVIACNDKTLQVWDVATCTPIGEQLVGHNADVHRIRLSADGMKICSLDMGGQAFVWDTVTHETIGPLQLPSESCFITDISLACDQVIGLVMKE